MSRRRLLFGVLGFGPGGRTSWLGPDAAPGDVTDIRRFIDQAKAVEEALIDVLFLADGVVLDRESTRYDPAGGLEPITALSAVAVNTEHVGLVPTASTTFTEPYNLARALASLDHISGGRAGWNVVTSSGGHTNFNLSELPPQEERYDRAREFVEVATRLWDSWDADSVIFDQERRIYADPDRIHPIDFRGRHFSVEGPLNIQRTPQGRPVLFQAGSSSSGKQFGGEIAEVIYTAQQDRDASRQFRTDINSIARKAGRDTEVKVLPGLSPVIGATEAEARDIEESILASVDYRKGIAALEKALGGADLSDLELDERIPEERLPDTSTLRARQSRPEIFRQFALHDDHTLRDVVNYLSRAYGHGIVRGTPESVAAHIRDWFESGASDGFIFMPAGYADGFSDFATRVVPILQDWGLYQRQYGSGTLRENLGLAAPASTRLSRAS